MAEHFSIPRLVIAGTHSGVGKTSITAALTKAYQARGMRVAVFKCGPDYLDPTYHTAATGMACENLDGWLMGREGVLTTFHLATQNADLAIIEGVMGLFDGLAPRNRAGSTAEIAAWLESPICLVVDAGGMAESVAALVGGFDSYDVQSKIGAVICNRIGSAGHLEILRKSLHRPPILGAFPKQDAQTFPSRHLGLKTAQQVESLEDMFDVWGELARTGCDLDKLLNLARSAPPIGIGEPLRVSSTRRCRMAIAEDEAFHFYYASNLRILESLGCELVPFSPMGDASLPDDVDGLYIGGGYPELHAAQLASNKAMRGSISDFARSGAPVYGECGGLMYLVQGIQDLEGRRHEMLGLLPGVAVMADKLQALGYVEVVIQAETILGGVGLRFRGHQFRYSTLENAENAEYVYAVHKRRNSETIPEGYRLNNILGSYVHAHWLSNPLAAAGLVNACERFRNTGKRSKA